MREREKEGIRRVNRRSDRFRALPGAPKKLLPRTRKENFFSKINEKQRNHTETRKKSDILYKTIENEKY